MSFANLTVETKKAKTDTEEEHELPDYFEWLPTELIELIVTCGLLELRDYCSLTRVSKKFKVIVDRLWKGHAQKRYVHLYYSDREKACHIKISANRSKFRKEQ